jgi:polar amino acid transport system permease protein
MHYHWDLAMVLADTDRWWHGIGITLLYSVATVAGGIVIGVFCGLALLGQKRWLTLPLEGYVEIFRCTPLLIQIVWFYYALPILLNFSLPAWLAAGLGLTLYMGAFCTEIFRAGVMSIGRGQWQAGRALGMTYAQLMRRIVLPQAVRRMIPPLVNQSITQLKNTASLRRGGARPDVYQLDHHRRDLSPPRGLYERRGHLFHHAVPADIVRQKAGDAG